MKAVRYMDDKSVIEKSVEILLKNLGPMDAIRFFNLTRAERMDSVKWHRDWQRKLDKQQFFDDVFK